MLKTPLFILLALMTAGFYSCSKEGPGGKSSIEVHVAHHGTNIPGSTVYIKYNAKESPGTDPAGYDASKKLADTGHLADHVHFSELHKGDYFLYAVGFDSSINMEVRGGIHVKLGKADEKEVTVPVTE